MHPNSIREIGLYHLYFYRAFSERDREPRYGLLVDEKTREDVLKLLNRNYKNNIVNHMSIITGYIQYIIEGVSVTIPREDRERREYMAFAFSGEALEKVKGIVEKLGLKYNGEKVICGE